MNFSDGKIFHILRELTRSELRNLGFFIETGLGGPAGKSSELLNLLMAYHPQFSNNLLNKEKLHRNLFNEAVYNEKNLRYALTDLYRQTIAFMAHSRFAENTKDYDIILRDALAKRGAEKAYRSLPDPEKFDEKSGSAEVHLKYFKELIIHLNEYLSKQNRSDPETLIRASRHLDVYYITTKLQILCELLNSKNVMVGEFDFLLQKELEEVLEKGALSGIPVVEIYFRIFKTLQEPDNENHFNTLKETLTATGDSFEKTELHDMYQYLMNYCIKKINQGETKYVNSLFEIYVSVLNNKIIYNGKHLSQWDFKNMVVIGLRANKNTWTEDFIKNHIQDLPKDDQKSAFAYNMAYLYFSNRAYNKALQQLREAEFTDIYYQLDMRSIILKCYYEMHEEDSLMYHLSAFRIFLSRNKTISEYQRIIYRNLVKYTGKLLTASSNKTKIIQLQKEIEEVRQIADINWIRKKTAEALLACKRN